MASNRVLSVCARGIVALFVWGLAAFALLRWRRKTGAGTTQFRSKVGLEIAWTIVPLVLVCIPLSYTYRAEVEALVADPGVTVAANGCRRGWSSGYRGGPFSKVPQLMLPLDEKTRIILTSSDVNHALWVPAFLFKHDAIPGSVTTLTCDRRKTVLLSDNARSSAAMRTP